MVVHVVFGKWDAASDRFLGPEALLDRAKAFLPELNALMVMPSEWASWVDALEISDSLVPVLRWRMPEPALHWLWAQHDERADDMSALWEQAESGVSASWSFYRACANWTHDPGWARSAHPLDEPSEAWTNLLERPEVVPWSSGTYAPLLVTRNDKGLVHEDTDRCVPLFRRWQALMLAEVVLEEPRSFPPIKGASSPPEPFKARTWYAGAGVRRLRQRRDVLEALSWFVSYRQHAFQHARTTRPDEGLFARPEAARDSNQYVVTGDALQALIVEEERVAREALARHGVDEDALLVAASAFGWMARERKRTGHADLSKAYADLMRDAIELMVSLGHRRDEVTGRMRDGDSLRRDFFPDFTEDARRKLRTQLRSIAADFNEWVEPDFPAVSDSGVDGFIEWLERQGLLAAHMSVPAIMSYGHRPDRSADVGNLVHVAALAAWLEHVVTELTRALPTPPRNLSDKLLGCWKRHRAQMAFRRAWDSRATNDQLQFAQAVKAVMVVPVGNRVEWMARDARLARLIRNECLHRGLHDLNRVEMHDALCILLRAALGAWLVNG